MRTRTEDFPGDVPAVTPPAAKFARSRGEMLLSTVFTCSNVNDLADIFLRRPAKIQRNHLPSRDRTAALIMQRFGNRGRPFLGRRAEGRRGGKGGVRPCKSGG